MTQYGQQNTCFNRACPTRKEPIDGPARVSAELKATAAVRALGSKRHDLSSGVTIGFLRKFLAQHDCGAKTTYEVVRDIIKPMTRQWRCRFVELPEVVATGFVGKARVFVSHTWGASFGLLVAALRHAFNDDDDMIAWVDVFAVRQFAGNDGDLAFERIVGDMDAFVLIGTHVDSVAEMGIWDGRVHFDDDDMDGIPIAEMAERVFFLTTPRSMPTANTEEPASTRRYLRYFHRDLSGVPSDLSWPSVFAVGMLRGKKNSCSGHPRRR